MKNVTSCFDPKRECIYIGGRSYPAAPDSGYASWVYDAESRPRGNPADWKIAAECGLFASVFEWSAISAWVRGGARRPSAGPPGLGCRKMSQFVAPGKK